MRTPNGWITDSFSKALTLALAMSLAMSLATIVFSRLTWWT